MYLKFSKQGSVSINYLYFYLLISPLPLICILHIIGTLNLLCTLSLETLPDIKQCYAMIMYFTNIFFTYLLFVVSSIYILVKVLELLSISKKRKKSLKFILSLLIFYFLPRIGVYFLDAPILENTSGAIIDFLIIILVAFLFKRHYLYLGFEKISFEDFIKSKENTNFFKNQFIIFVISIFIFISLAYLSGHQMFSVNIYFFTYIYVSIILYILHEICFFYKVFKVLAKGRTIT